MTKVKDKYAFEVEGVTYTTSDDDLDGRQVRTISGHDPAADWRLIQIHDRYTQAIGLEDPVLLQEGEKPVFRIMEGDRTFDFTVQDRGWEWGAATIGEAEIREYGKIAENREVVVEKVGNEEIVIPRGGVIRLDDAGIERIYSRVVQPPKKLKIIFVINGEPTEVHARPSDRLETVLEKALKESENTGQPAGAWQVTDEPGTLLDVTKALGELGIIDGAVLLASLKAGAAG